MNGGASSSHRPPPRSSRANPFPHRRARSTVGPRGLQTGGPRSRAWTPDRSTPDGRQPTVLEAHVGGSPRTDIADQQQDGPPLDLIDAEEVPGPVDVLNFERADP